MLASLELWADFLVVPETAPPLLGKENCTVPWYPQIKLQSHVSVKLVICQVPRPVRGHWMSEGYRSDATHRQVRPPVARKHSHTPFHMRDKVSRPGKNRLCVDTRDANRAIPRIRHITLTIEELTTDLNSATIFSKLDLHSDYHQLTLHPSCRYITTFLTHLGLYHCKRLNFGINARFRQ